MNAPHFDTTCNFNIQSVALRNFSENDINVLQKYQYNFASYEKVKSYIAEWNCKTFNGKYFEIFAVVNDTAVVGSISVYQYGSSIISCDPEVFELYRKNGFAYKAILLALQWSI